MPASVKQARTASPTGMLRQVMSQHLLVASVRSFLQHNGMTTSAALAFYFLMSLLPFLIFLASALALLPIPHLAPRMIQLASHFVPSETMPVVQKMLTATMHTNNQMLSIGFILAVVATSSAFAATASALDITYGSTEKRSFWRGRLLAIGITMAVGGLTAVALIVMLLGPHFGREIARVFDVSRTFAEVWPVLRYILAITCALASVEVLYYLGPSQKHSLSEQFPGSVLAVVAWIGSLGVLGIYLRRFSYFNVMYGTLASFIVLMLCLQITAAAILLGAELNVQLAKWRGSMR